MAVTCHPSRVSPAQPLLRPGGAPLAAIGSGADQKPRLLGLIALLAAALMLFAACGGSSGDASSTTDTNTSDTEARASSTSDASTDAARSSDSDVPSMDDASGSDDAADGSADTSADEAVAEGEVAGVTIFDITEANHVEGPVDYPMQPPAGGNHSQGWQNCGFYTIEVPSEQAVHSLEHGAVWITYNDQTADADLTQLEALASGSTHLLVTRFPSQGDPLVLTAWGRQLAVDSLTDERVVPFIEAYMIDGPATPEPGAICASAYGIPPDDAFTIN